MRALGAMPRALEPRVDEILVAKCARCAGRGEAEIGSALLDRLRLTPDRVAAYGAGVREIRLAARSRREVLEGSGCPTAWSGRKVRVPLGVVAVVYESRPNVTIDCTALALKVRQRDRACAGRRWPPTRCAPGPSWPRDAVASAAFPRCRCAGRGRRA